MSGLLDGKRLLVTGVLTPQSIAFACARVLQEHGAELMLTGFGRGLSLTQRSAKRLPREAEVLSMDVNDPAEIEAVAGELQERWETLDGLLHAIAFAPDDALGGNFLHTPWESAATALQTSAFSFKALVAAHLRLLERAGGSAVTLDFDASVAWPGYDWMGVSKAALEAVTRYLARDVGRRGVRVNAVSAGPLRTVAAKSIPGFNLFTDVWHRRAPLGWDVTDPGPVGGAVAFLLSDLSRGITGEIIHVDGGYHAMGADLHEPSSDG